MQITITRPDGQHGPYSVEEVNRYLAMGHLQPHDLAWYEGATDWFPLHQVPGVQLPQRSAPPPPPVPSYGYGAPQGSSTVSYATSQPYAGSSVGSGREPIGSERTVFEATPTLAPDLVLSVVTCGLWLCVLPFRWWAVQGIKYRLTTERLIVTRGRVGRNVEEVELYRVKDVTTEQGTLGRMLGFGTVVVHTNDASAPRIALGGISNPLGRKEQIRGSYRSARRTEGVRTSEYQSSH